ncbi:MAG: TIGR01244 family sulfur transferase [Burkholderiaceae bacterium]
MPDPTFIPASDTVCTAAQLAPADMDAVARAGFRSVINNRPDGEGGPGQPHSDDIRQAAEALGLVYVYQPVDSANIRPQDVAEFGQLLAKLPPPVLAFCRSGARSRRLHDSAQQATGG